MARTPDLAFETLAKVTDANVDFERGKLNAALKAIRSAWQREGGISEDLPQEIELRADAYRAMWPTMALTPPALASHWHRVMAQRQVKTPQQQAIDDLRREQ